VPAIDTIRHYFAGVTIGPSSMVRYSATGFNANEVAIILALGIPMAWYLAVSTDEPIYRLLNVCYVPLALVAVLLSGSRGAFLGLLVALLLVPWSTGWLSRRARVGLIGLLVVSTCLIYVMVPTASWKRLAQTETEIADGNFSGRGEIWKSALQVFMDHPVAGFGAGAFEDAGSRDRPAINSHQTFLSVLTGQGLVGFGLFVSMLAVACNSIRWMRGLQRRFWIVLCLSLFIALLPRDWDFRKQPWFVLGLLTAQGALTRRMDARMATPTPPVGRLHAVPAMGIAREGLRHRPI
jgi:O-antigen ligase